MKLLRGHKYFFDRLNLISNSVIFITSDNGGDVNGSVGSLRGRKQQTFEGGQRVPMIVFAPNHITQNRVSDDLSTNLDIVPTVMDLLDIDPPSDRIIDGKSIWSTLVNDDPSPHPYVFYNASGSGKFEGVRDQNFKYHEGGIGTAMPFMGIIGMTPPLKPQLTDIKLDNESHNLIKKYPDRAALLKSILDGKRNEVSNNRRGWLSTPD